MAPVIPVPRQVASCPVVAAITVPSRPGEPPYQFIVICQDPDAQVSANPYSTLRVGTADGREWVAGHGRHDLTWPEAVASFVSRASIPAAGYPGQTGNDSVR